MPPSTHILVVEDEEHLAKGIKYNLEAEGYQVTAVSDGLTALRLVEKHPEMDLIILDLMLPGMSGYAVCETLRATNKDLPVLILSARTLAEDRARGFDVGANQYLTKPFDLDEFLSRIKNLLALSRHRAQRPAPQPEEISSFEFGRAKIDFETFKDTVAGEPVRMTRLELDLLKYFAQEQKTVLKEAFDKSVPIAAVNGKQLESQPIMIEGAELLTLKAFSRVLLKLYDESRRKNQES